MPEIRLHNAQGVRTLTPVETDEIRERSACPAGMEGLVGMDVFGDTSRGTVSRDRTMWVCGKCQTCNEIDAVTCERCGAAIEESAVSHDI